MLNLTLKTPNKKEALAITLGLFLLALLFENLELINLFSKNSDRGFFYDYQIVIGGLLAFGAGYFVYNSTQLTLNHEKEKETKLAKKYRIYYAKNCTDYVVKAEALYDWLGDGSPSVNSQHATQKFESKFFVKDDHIRFFNHEEVEILSLIEVAIHHSSMLIDRMIQFNTMYPNKGYAKHFNRKSDGKFLKGLSKKAEELAKSIDEDKYLKWRSS